MRLFGEFDVRLDPWDVEYGSEIPVEAEDAIQRGESVDATVETADAWQPIAPAAGESPAEIVFVDGVRRADARVLVRRRSLDGSPSDDVMTGHGVFGTFAVGGARVGARGASWGSARVERLLATGGGVLLAPEIAVTRGVVYRPRPVADSDPEAPLRAVQADMRLAEERAALEVASAENLVVVDGPLPPSLCGAAPGAAFDGARHGRAIGLVKRIHELYVGDRARVLPRLGVGERTPLFALRSSSRFARYSWFLRLARPGPGESDLTGLVRLEVAEQIGRDEARRLADIAARVLPRYAPTRSRDPRSPQNLLPIGALEGHLRRLLGDRRLVRRHIQTLLSRGGGLG